MGNEFGFLHLCDADESFQSTLSTPFYSVRKIKNEAIHFRDINIIKNTVKEHTLLLMETGLKGNGRMENRGTSQYTTNTETL